jgi:predicted transcriptional regulator of viral defense system
MVGDTSETPDRDRLYEIAAAQDGLFTTQQAAEVGYSPQLLVHHIRGERMQRVRRGIYRLVHFPAGEHEEVVTVWLWSEQAGVLSHETALALHGLSDALPAQVHLTLPAAWKKRRFRVPKGVCCTTLTLSRRIGPGRGRFRSRRWRAR